MSRLLNIGTTQKIILQEEVSVTTDTVSIDSVIDDGQSVTANVSFGISNSNKQLMLWNGTDYTNIGEWTTTDVNNRITQLLTQ